MFRNVDNTKVLLASFFKEIGAELDNYEKYFIHSIAGDKFIKPTSGDTRYDAEYTGPAYSNQFSDYE